MVFFFSIFTGPINTRHIRYTYCLPKPVRYAGLCSLQSARKAQTGRAGYQTDTRHIRAVLRGWDATFRWSRTTQPFWWIVPSHAGKN